VSTIVEKDCRGTYPKSASLRSSIMNVSKDLHLLLRAFVKPMSFQHLQEFSGSRAMQKWANSSCVVYSWVGLQPTLWDSLQPTTFTVAYRASYNPNSAGFGGFQSSSTDNDSILKECTFTEAVGVSTCPLALYQWGSRTIANRNLFQISSHPLLKRGYRSSQHAEFCCCTN